ncbi:hypothetical protein N7492_009261 [Penicillium capsulatum]|uniref:N-acetyltransferase domain-containing protein n=1 Tax=Penicillium capsulatum TaxID=69766 RepID=A0A9W9HRB6_9EURO|nr:hypothetical protein N7492_009261 [Penicillium capsulatum]KAJ6106655.1 hypothetical protein N7512_010172 [Penicillium capsulatum]
MSIDIVPLAPADIPDAVDCVQRAFADDPYFRWVFSDSSKFNLQRNAASLAAHFQYGINCGCPISVAKIAAAGDRKTDREIKLPSGTIVGVAWWYSPRASSEAQTWLVWAQDWLLSFRQFVNNARFGGRGGLSLSRYWIWKRVQQDAHDQLWTDPRGYYFCNMVGVSSLARGMGVGKRLMEDVMAKADREGMPCYLESSKGHPNVTIYEKMGFTLVKEIECVEDGDVCKLYCMIRNPKTKS